MSGWSAATSSNLAGRLCECGFVARGDSDDQVVGMIRGHLASDHPGLLESVSREDLISWIKVE
jgi:predicted small metal-binding protein